MQVTHPTTAERSLERLRSVSPVARAQLLAALVTVTAVCLQAPARAFVYDAGTYWNGAMAVLGHGDVYGQGLLDLRGVTTSFLYIPAALVVKLTGGSGAGPAVLVENALLIGGMGAWLLPRIVGLWRPVTPAAVWVSAAVTAVLLRGFAPYPLTDLWGAALLLGAVAALRSRGWDQLLVAGLCAGFAFNVRPAALIAVVLLGAAVLAFARLSGLWFVAGAVLALLPQMALGYWRDLPWYPWPARTGWLTELQAGLAPYVVRYDTVLNQEDHPSLVFCSPSMAHALHGTVPRSPGELAGVFLAHFPKALVLSAEKLGAALHWSIATPYFAPAPVVNGLFALVVTATAVGGAAVLLRAAVRRGRALSLGHVAVLLVWVGSLLSLVSSAVESRFALPVLLIGIAGVATLAADGARLPVARAGRLWLAGAVLAVLAVLAIGSVGLQHPYVGNPSLEACAGA